MTKATEITVPETGAYLALATDTETPIADIISENVGPGGISPADLEKIQVPAGAATVWSIPTLDGNEPAKEIIGIIVHHRNTRAYYSTPYDGSKNPPDCFSRDCVTGIGNPGGACQICDLSKFGSKADGYGQACSERKMILVLREESLLPIIISAPTGSLGTTRKYMLRLANGSLKFSDVETRFSLSVAKSRGGIEYAQIQCGMERRLTADEKATFSSYRAAILPAFDAVDDLEDRED